MPALIEPNRSPSTATAIVPLVHVVDDDVSIQSLFRTICAQAGYEVRVYGSITSFHQRTAEERPGCLVLDLMLPDGTGIDVLQQLSQEGNQTPVVFMSGMASVAEAVRALKLGSLDFVQKPFDLSCMREALDRAVTLDLQRRERATEQTWLRKRFQHLSPRETEVMERIVRGAANKEVALQLGLSPKTVEVHRANVMRKTGANSLAELVRMHVTVHGRGNNPDQ